MMVAAVNDSWEDGWQMTTSGDGGGWRWQAISGDVEQRRMMVVAGRGRGSG